MKCLEKLDLHVVFDKYLESSIKRQTRVKRGDNQCGIKYRLQSDLPVPPNWKQFLSIAENKANLADYYSDYLNENAGMALRDRQTLFIGGGQDDKAIKVTNSGNYSVRLLKSNQEEADTRICLHARVAAETGSKCIVVSSPDTDVLVLLLHHQNDICVDRLFFLTGREGKHANLSRFIPIHNIYDQLSKEQLSILLVVYCLTGCDTTSSFWGHGKKAAFRIMMSKSGDYQDLALLNTRENCSNKVCRNIIWKEKLYFIKCPSMREG